MESRSRPAPSDRRGAAKQRESAFVGLAVGLALAGCAAGSSTRGRAGPPTDAGPPAEAAAPSGVAAPSPPDREPWDLAAQLPSLRTAAPVHRSEHLGGDLEGEVLVNAAASTYPALGPTQTVTEGAVLVEALRAPGEPTKRTFLAMRKRAPGFDPAGADWEYAVAGPGGVIEERGAIPGCRRCHAEAPHEHLFGSGSRP